MLQIEKFYSAGSIAVLHDTDAKVLNSNDAQLLFQILLKCNECKAAKCISCIGSQGHERWNWNGKYSKWECSYFKNGRKYDTLCHVGIAKHKNC